MRRYGRKLAVDQLEEYGRKAGVGKASVWSAIRNSPIIVKYAPRTYGLIGLR